MDLVQRLRTEIDAVSGAEAEALAPMCGGRRRAVVVGERACVRDEDEALRVIRRGAVELVIRRRDEVIHIRDAGRVGMAEGGALHRREAAEGEQVAQRLEADVLVEEDVEAELRDDLPCLLQVVVGQRDDVIGGSVHLRAELIGLERAEADQKNFMRAAVELLHQAARGVADAVTTKEARGQTELDAPLGGRPAQDVGCGPVKRRRDFQVQARELLQQRLVADAVIRQRKVGRWEGRVLRVRRDLRDEQRFPDEVRRAIRCGELGELAERGRCFGELTEMLLQLGQVLEHPDVRRIGLQRLSIERDGFVMSLRKLQDRAEVVQRVGVARIGGDGRAELLLRRFLASVERERDAEVVQTTREHAVRERHVVAARDRLAAELRRRGEIAGAGERLCVDEQPIHVAKR